MNDMKSLQKKLETNPVARTRFLADLLGTLERSGVDIQDPKVNRTGFVGESIF